VARETQVEVVVVKAALTFPLTVQQAQDPVMKHSLEAGVAMSLGLESNKVSIAYFWRHRRQLIAGSVSLFFEIQSASKEATQVAALKSNFIAAATEGSLVANVQKEALENGVLIAALKDMSRALPEPTVTDGTKSITIITQVRPNEPDDDSVGTTKEKEDSAVSDGAKAGAAIGPACGCALAGWVLALHWLR
jgi:hypothetical protein